MFSNVVLVADAVRAARYPDAEAIFAAGSLLRGEGTPNSDIDLVVLYCVLPHAYRESFTFAGTPVEAFVHDPQTLEYFFSEVDRPSGIPSLPHMVSEGVELPAPTVLTQDIKRRANALLAAGPPPLDEEKIRRHRCAVTDLLDDLAEPRSTEEMVAITARVFKVAADFYVRYHGRCSGRGKWLVRSLAAMDDALAIKCCAALRASVANADARPLTEVIVGMLDACGGRIFDGHRLDAPTSWRREVSG